MPRMCCDNRFDTVRCFVHDLNRAFNNKKEIHAALAALEQRGSLGNKLDRSVGNKPFDLLLGQNWKGLLFAYIGVACIGGFSSCFNRRFFLFHNMTSASA